MRNSYLFMACVLALICFALYRDGAMASRNAGSSFGGTSYLEAAPLDSPENAAMRSYGFQTNFLIRFYVKNHEVNEVQSWVDVYRKGDFQTPQKIGTSITEDGLHMLTWNVLALEHNQELWILSERKDGNSTSTRLQVEQKPNLSSMSQTLAYKQPIEKGKVYDLGIIVKSSGGMIQVRQGDIEQTIRDNEEVYVYRCSFQ